MSAYTFAQRKRTGNIPSAEMKNRAVPSGPSMDALRSGMAAPSAEQMGSRVDLPEAIRAKFEESFGADLSGVKLYRSQAVADAGANAVARGSSIAFAPGKLDFTSSGGQALLGHELSHVVSQARGEVRGSGFLDDPALEARADREGVMAAAGQTVYSAPRAAISNTSAAPAAAPMQASKPQKPTPLSEQGVVKPSLAGKVKAKMKPRRIGQPLEDARPGFENLQDDLDKKYGGKLKWSEVIARAPEKGEEYGESFTGLAFSRILDSLKSDRGRGFDMSPEKVTALMDKLAAPKLLNKDASDEEREAANIAFDEGMNQLKGIYSDDLNNAEKQYGTILTQMHPGDVLPQLAGDNNYDRIATNIMDISNFISKGKRYFNQDDENDQRFVNLGEYYGGANMALSNINSFNAHGYSTKEKETYAESFYQEPLKLENKIGGPRMNGEEQDKYLRGLKKRAKGRKFKAGKNFLFGRFK